MPRTARHVDALPEEVLEAAASEFRQCAVKALEGLVLNQRQLADRLGWPETTLSSALKGGFTFSTWPSAPLALYADLLIAQAQPAERGVLAVVFLDRRTGESRRARSSIGRSPYSTTWTGAEHRR